MRKSKSFTFGITVSMIIFLLPVICIVYCKIKSYIVFDIFVWIPVVAFLLSSVIVLIRKVPDIIKVIFPVLILTATLFCVVGLNLVGGHVEFRTFDGLNEIEEYYEDFNEKKYGKYEGISHYMYHSTGILMCFNADTTILEYDKESFEKEKKNIETDYKFYSAPIEKEEPVPLFSYAGFDFKVERSKSPAEWYPKQLYLIGINEKSCEIAYVYFEDYDLDGVSDFNDILDFYCGWSYVLKERYG